MAKRIFISGTGKDVGKTSISLALIHLLNKHYQRIGYIKPISQRFVYMSGRKAGDDPVLIKQTFQLSHDISDMSPVVIDGDLTKKVIRGEVRKSYSRTVSRAFKHIEQESDFVIVEGAGRASIGSVIRQSNADTARLLNADVLLVGGGGLGRAIDNVMLDKAFFESRGCRVIGVVINKVYPWKYDVICPLLQEWFHKERIPLLGVLPYHASLSWPGLLLAKKETRAKILNSAQDADRKIEHVIIAAKGIDSILDDLRRAGRGTLLVVSVDQTDIFFFLISPYFKNMACSKNIAGVLISGCKEDTAKVEEIFSGFWAPVLVSPYSIYDTAVKIHDLKPKMLLDDEQNIKMLKTLSETFIDLDRLQERINSSRDFSQRTFQQDAAAFLYDLIQRCIAAVKKFLKK
ncbi:MAG: AAA family ATPase [Candidatus Omnitrophota bacterium]